MHVMRCLLESGLNQALARTHQSLAHKKSGTEQLAKSLRHNKIVSANLNAWSRSQHVIADMGFHGSWMA